MKKRKIKNDLSYAIVSICVISALSSTPVLASTSSSSGVKVSQESVKNKKAERREIRKKYVSSIRAADREHWAAISNFKKTMKNELKNAKTDSERAQIRENYRTKTREERKKMTLAKTTAQDSYKQLLGQLK